ncbi:MAG: hypothetical protein WCI75_19130, partial [candidate division NC10 bacterium]
HGEAEQLAKLLVVGTEEILKKLEVVRRIAHRTHKKGMHLRLDGEAIITLMILFVCRLSSCAVNDLERQ